MASNLILTTAQAQAVYSAMCALDALGPDHGAEFHLGDWVYVRRVHLDGAIRIEDRADGDDERHDDLAAFAAAYGLRAVPDAADLLAALNTAHMALIGYLPAHRNAVTDAAIETCRATIARNSA
ncbi:hypothetical protein NH44784_000481 [Achromobacter xylosoxidans NH44784-1996]|uniref:hypothetical protein n=1 Tax=Alcaligenes xylosoxydans xylosoxydans TaxID=85698 RepID=UPI0003322143|nr:hypothetical protein [Achromobacter xylosoxidans]CCH04040.1 hypothetical protein NH44784_000481 [Achromobacter xylosoxidans NH44784-1996]